METGNDLKTPSDSGSDAFDMLSEKRVIFFDKDVSEASASELIAKILAFNIKDRTGKKPIIILINSVGGETYSSMGVIDTIQASKCPVYTVCIGSAQSAACMILMAGKKRYALPNARIMAHPHWQQYDHPLNHHELMVQSDESLRLHTQLVTIFQECTGLHRDDVERLLLQDSYFTAEDAKRHNIIDEIGWDIWTWLK